MAQELSEMALKDGYIELSILLNLASRYARGKSNVQTDFGSSDDPGPAESSDTVM
jgi:hypothetical protein